MFPDNQAQELLILVGIPFRGALVAKSAHTNLYMNEIGSLGGRYL